VVKGTKDRFYDALGEVYAKRREVKIQFSWEFYGEKYTIANIEPRNRA
jgi:hypothetical protein